VELGGVKFHGALSGHWIQFFGVVALITEVGLLTLCLRRGGHNER
jgi:hypothetical protein